ncbi:MAG: hypothetical protein COW30_06630 [Rhodospirillales bacterium CG15_BIG_FIL_POST_REV_8_21_14_020_66_15]|nr:MAG: hypothetical protein COW30_06630 [Rhodospirillales bacterium CG15_BIG_FIL_POST_REV_8_21_14_020_66_15]
MMKGVVRRAQLLGVAVAVLTALFVSIPPAAAGDDGSWTLAESSGAVHITRSGIRPVALTTGDLVGPGQRVVTDADGHAVLRRGKNTIVVSPNSILEVPNDVRDGLMSRIRYVLGTLLFDVEKRKEQHFEVLTPDVAVVVKGTTFTTTVGPQGAVVHVISGLVQVADIRSGQSVFVRPGQTAVSPQGGGRVDIQGNPSGAPGAGKQKAGGGKAEAGRGTGGVKIAHDISGQTQSLGQMSTGLLRRDTPHGKGIGNGAGGEIAGFGPPIGDNGFVENRGGHIPQGLAVGLTGATPPGLVNNPNAGGGGPNAGGGSPFAGGGNPFAGGGNPNAGGGNPNAGGNNGNGKNK